MLSMMASCDGTPQKQAKIDTIIEDDEDDFIDDDEEYEYDDEYDEDFDDDDEEDFYTSM